MRTSRPGVACAGLLAGLIVATLATPSFAAADVQLSPATMTPVGGLTLLATVPPGLSDRALPSSAFTATQAGQPVPLTAARLIDSSVTLVLALDTSGAGTALAAEQSAAADLLRTLPPQTPTTVLPGPTTTTAANALTVLARLRPSSGRLLDGQPAAATGRRLAVLLTGCPAVDAETRALAGAGTEVSVLALGPGCAAGAARLAGDQPGVVRTGLDTNGLLSGVDEVSRAILGQYVLTSAGPVDSQPLDVTVTFGGLVSRGSTTVRAAPLPLADGASQPRSAVPFVVAGVLAVLAALALGAELLAQRRTPALR